jgi:hypothetical protein
VVPERGRCERWPEPLALAIYRADSGEVARHVRGACGCVNKCRVCARSKAVENAEVLAIDAMETGGPEVWIVLGTRSDDADPVTFYKAREYVIAAVRRRWPGAGYCGLVEFTTGHGPRAGGKRRPHWNLLLKGVPGDQVAELEEVVRRIWCAHVDAEPERQYVGTVREAGGLMRYLALHFQKESQAPPEGWSGHRFIHGGYFSESLPTLRERARLQLQFKREVWKIEVAVVESLALGQGMATALARSTARGLHTADRRELCSTVFDAEEVDELAERAMEQRARERCELVRLHDAGKVETADVDRGSWGDVKRFLRAMRGVSIEAVGGA